MNGKARSVDCLFNSLISRIDSVLTVIEFSLEVDGLKSPFEDA